jgi:glycosyltransferase involved in cell wall biosynthesis
MRIAFVTTEFVTQPLMTGGLAVYTDRVTQWLARNGHEATVIAFSPENRVQERCGVEVHELAPGSLHQGSRRFLGKRLNLTSMMMDFSIRTSQRLRRLHSIKPFDLVQYTNIFGVGIIPSMTLQMPSLTRMSSYRPPMNVLRGNTNRDYKALEKIEEYQMRRSRHLFCASRYLQRVVRENLGLEINVIASPFYQEVERLDDVVYKNRLEGEDYLLFFSKTLQTLKGTFVLAETLSQVLDAYPKLKAVIVGGDLPAGSEHPSLTARQRFNKIYTGNSSQLVFLDALPHSQLYPIISHARLVVLPSLTENLSNACMEAMGLGRPVVGTRGISFDELIEDGISGFLSEPGDVADLRRVILEALGRPDLDQVGQAARERMKWFSPEVVMPKLIDYYRMVIAAG